MKNGMPLNIIHAGNEDVVRFDLLIGGGQWNQEQPLQAMFTNRMLREGAGNLTSAQIAERLDYYGAWLELSSSVNYGFITLYSLNKYFARTLAVISEMIKAPAFPAKELSVVADTNKQFRHELFRLLRVCCYESVKPLSIALRVKIGRASCRERV